MWETLGSFLASAEALLVNFDLILGVKWDLRQQLITNISALYKVGMSRLKSAWGSEMPHTIYNAGLTTSLLQWPPPLRMRTNMANMMKILITMFLLNQMIE